MSENLARPATLTIAEQADHSIESPGRRALRRFLRHKLAIFGLVVLTIMGLAALFAPLIAPYDPAAQDLVNFRQAPSQAHWLGTDGFGRDVLSRLIWGARPSLSVGLIAVTFYESIAIVLGSLAGYYGGKVDWIIMRAVDVVMTFPSLIIIIFLVAILGPGLRNTIVAIAILRWTEPTRLVRGQILSLREMDYVLSARSLGAKDGRIIRRHILPGVVAPLVVHATFGVATAILLEAALSFLNLGILPPAASWGNMMTAAQELVILEQMPWLWLPPGLAIMLAVLSINFVGDGLRDALDTTRSE
ncbi:MAG: peptide/nickel transport system permease protein [Cellvibrionaceae bacterium]|jgi:peptide/nickel transport system permease protein